MPGTPNVVVNTKHLTKLVKYLERAQASVDLAFAAPTSSAGNYPKKLSDTHGATATMGENAIMGVISGSREEVHRQLNIAIKSQIEAIEAAKKAYEATDEDQSKALDDEVDTSV